MDRQDSVITQERGTTEMAFHVGQKVVCVDVDPDTFKPPTNEYYFDKLELEKGAIYTVRWFGWFEDEFGGDWCMRVNEICGRRDRFCEDVPFLAIRFRPVVERKTSIEIFQRMLTPKKEHVNA